MEKMEKEKEIKEISRYQFLSDGDLRLKVKEDTPSESKPSKNNNDEPIIPPEIFLG